MSPSLNSLNADFVRRKSASMCFSIPPTLEELSAKWAQSNNLAPSAAALISKKKNDDLLTPKSTKNFSQQQRNSICLSLLRGDKVSIQSAIYRDNMLPNRRESVINLSNQQNKHSNKINDLTISDLAVLKKPSLSSEESLLSNNSINNNKSVLYYPNDSLIEKCKNCTIVIEATSIIIQEEDNFL